MEKNYYLEIGKILKELRQKNNMTKTQLADGICSISYITRIEKGERCPTSIILRQITNKLGISCEYLFRAIESPTAIEVDQLINQIFHYYERQEPYNIYKLIIENEEKLEILSIYDRQIIETFKCLCTSYIDKDFEKALLDMGSILKRTYIKGTTPNEIEFFQLFFYGIFLNRTGQFKEAINHLNNLQIYINSITFFHSYAIVADFYAYLAKLHLSICKLDDCNFFIEKAIIHCKKYNVHAILRRLYCLKGEMYAKLNRDKESKLWYHKAITLNQLICTTTEDSKFSMGPLMDIIEELKQ